MSGQPVFIRLTSTSGFRAYLDATTVALFCKSAKGEGTEVIRKLEDPAHAYVLTFCETPDEVLALLRAAGIKCFGADASGEVGEVE